MRTLAISVALISIVAAAPRQLTPISLASPRYRVVPLPLVNDNSDWSAPSDVNDDGTIVGAEGYTSDFGFRGVLWVNGTVRPMPLLDGTHWCWTMHINKFGDVVGSCAGPGISSRAVAWHNGSVLPIGPDGIESFAWSLNNKGYVVGTVGPQDYRKAVRFTQTGYSVLSAAAHGDEEVVKDVNDAAQAVGISVTSDKTWDAVAWAQGTRYTFEMGAEPSAINSHGDIAGYSLDPEGTHVPTVWRSGVPLVLASWGDASDVNDNGDVIGSFSPDRSFKFHPFLFRNGILYDVTTLIDGPQPFTTLGEVLAINNRGVIVGHGQLGGRWLAYALVPVP